MTETTPHPDPAAAPDGSRLGALADDGFAWSIVDLAPDGILVIDATGTIMMANRRVEELFGYDHAGLVGSSVESLVPAQHRAAHVDLRARFHETPAIRAMGTGLDLAGCRADGSHFPIEISLSPIATNDGTMVLVVVRDVTDQRATERAARDRIVLAEYERIAADMQDRVISHLYASGLTLASLLARNDFDAATTDRLYEVIDELDHAAIELRRTVFGPRDTPVALD